MIFSVYHKDAPFVINDLYKVIKVGSARKEFIHQGYKDCEGENISNKNSVFAEMTAQYWVWKNIALRPDDFIGFSHYRRHFDFTSRFNFRGRNTIFGDQLGQFLKVESKLKIDKYLKKYDAIVIKANVLRGISISEHYQSNHSSSDWNKMMNLLREMSPDYYITAKRLFRKKWVDFYQCNMFIMKSAKFHDYMSWIFPLLFKIEKQIDLKESGEDQKRIIGFIAERLMTLYFYHNKFNLLATPVLFVED